MSEENASKFFENYFDSDLQEYIYDILYYHPMTFCTIIKKTVKNIMT